MVLPNLYFSEAGCIALVGGADTLFLLRSGKKLSFPARQSILVQPGDELIAAPFTHGFRAYLAVSGGLCADIIQAKPIKNGDKLSIKRCPATFQPKKLTADPVPLPDDGVSVLRVMEGVHSHQFSPESLSAFYHDIYSYTQQSNRMGIRLSGQPICFADGYDGNIISEGMLPGDIQVTSAGQPILMMADCQTVGGYSKIAHLIAADLPLAAQLKPGSLVRFQQVRIEVAHAAWRRLHYKMQTCLADGSFCSGL